MIILPLGLLGVFPTVYKTQRKIRKKRLSLDTKILNTCDRVLLLTNFSKENKEISPFFEGGKKRLSFDTKILNTCAAFHLLTITSKENKEISPFLEGEKETIFRHQDFQHLR